MVRRKGGAAVHGWVIVDKPQGVTSTQAVGAVRRVFDAKKAGHAGTLDPLATGVLAVALGEATKTVPYAMDAAKTYRFTVTFGESRASDDSEGAVTGRCDHRPETADLEAAMARLTGAIRQVPPAFSAVKIGGERAYDLAREGESVQLEPRTVFVHSARLVSRPDPSHAEFEMVCGKGTYVRAWARDLARSLGTLGHVSQLRRLAIGNFTIDRAIGLDTLKGFMHSPAAFEHLRPISTALDGIPALAVSGQDAVRLKSGNPILIRPREFARIAEAAPADGDLQGLTVFLSTGEGEPVALACFAEGELRPIRVFNFATG